MFMVMPLQLLFRFTFESSGAEGKNKEKRVGLGVRYGEGGPGAVDGSCGQGERNAYVNGIMLATAQSLA